MAKGGRTHRHWPKTEGRSGGKLNLADLRKTTTGVIFRVAKKRRPPPKTRKAEKRWQKPREWHHRTRQAEVSMAKGKDRLREKREITSRKIRRAETLGRQQSSKTRIQKRSNPGSIRGSWRIRYMFPDSAAGWCSRLGAVGTDRYTVAVGRDRVNSRK